MKAYMILLNPETDSEFYSHTKDFTEHKNLFDSIISNMKPGDYLETSKQNNRFAQYGLRIFEADHKGVFEWITKGSREFKRRLS